MMEINLDTFKLVGKCLLRTAKGIYFNPPYTTIKWTDDTITTVKCTDGDTFSEEAGIALCFMKYFTEERFHQIMKDCIKNSIDIPAKQIHKSIKKKKKGIQECLNEIEGGLNGE